MKYPREWIDSVRERSDIVELIGSYVTLRRAGSNYTGFAPSTVNGRRPLRCSPIRRAFSVSAVKRAGMPLPL